MTRGPRRGKAAPYNGPVRHLPNALSLSRLPMAALVWAAPESPGWVLSLMVLAGITDLLDGWVARHVEARRGPDGRTGFQDVGAWLDPICDKVFVVSALAAVTYGTGTPLWVMLLVASREIIQIPLYLVLRRRGVFGRFDFRASMAGKAATVVQFAAVAALLFRHSAAVPLALLAALIGTLAAGYYVLRALRT